MNIFFSKIEKENSEISLYKNSKMTDEEESKKKNSNYFSNTQNDFNHLDDQIIDFLCDVKDKINNNFFKVCENGDYEKLKFFFNKKISSDKSPDINKKYLYNFTVLHISISNSKFA